MPDLTQADRDDLLIAMARQLANDGRQGETLRAVLNRVAPTPPIVLPDPVG